MRYIEVILAVACVVALLGVSSIGLAATTDENESKISVQLLHKCVCLFILSERFLFHLKYTFIKNEIYLGTF